MVRSSAVGQGLHPALRAGTGEARAARHGADASSRAAAGHLDARRNAVFRNQPQRPVLGPHGADAPHRGVCSGRISEPRSGNSGCAGKLDHDSSSDSPTGRKPGPDLSGSSDRHRAAARQPPGRNRCAGVSPPYARGAQDRRQPGAERRIPADDVKYATFAGRGVPRRIGAELAEPDLRRLAAQAAAGGAVRHAHRRRNVLPELAASCWPQRFRTTWPTCWRFTISACCWASAGATAPATAASCAHAHQPGGREDPPHPRPGRAALAGLGAAPGDSTRPVKIPGCAGWASSPSRRRC